MSDAFDHKVNDPSNATRINVYRSDKSYEWVHLMIYPIESPWPATTVIISLEAATELAHALLAAVHGDSADQFELRATMETMKAHE